MNCLWVLLFYFCTTVFSENDVKTYKGYKDYLVNGDRIGLSKLEERVKDFKEFLLINRHNGTSLEAIVAPELKYIFEKIVKEQNLQTKLIYDDVSKIIQLEKRRTRKLKRQGYEFSWTAYYDIDDIYGYIHNMSSRYPQWTELVVAGRSYEGRQIKGLRINTPGRGRKPAVFIESGIHAREWIAPATTTYFINQLLTSEHPEIVALRNLFDWHIFPSVNPDGYHYSFTKDRLWRKTRSKSPNGCYGADPNRNWDYNWLENGASNNPCDPDTYAGSKPFSEIETRTLSKYISRIHNLLAYIGFHSDAQTLLVPYSDSLEHMENYDDLVIIGETSLEYGYKVNGVRYSGPATAAEIMYKASGGSMDWVKDKLGTKLVFTYELRGTDFAWPAELIYQQGDEVTQMLLGLFKKAKELGYY